MPDEKKDVGFGAISPLDSRYHSEKIAEFLSDNFFFDLKKTVEWALFATLCERKICPSGALEEFERKFASVTFEDALEEESRVRHDIRALVNVFRAKLKDRFKPFVHLTATSNDIVSSAYALQFSKAINLVLIPELVRLEKTLINLAIKEASTVQIGRTHGQHAVPITFGYFIAGYIERIGNCIVNLNLLAKKLPGKMSGAVGAYNASSLLFNDPEVFEKEVLKKIGLEPAGHSTQITQPEPVVRLFSEITIACGVMANLADDMRHLQRTEIGEIKESFGKNQVGSTTMANKNNPISFEHVKSLWKIVLPRIMTVFMDQNSEHQRDLTNSASMRTYVETIAYAIIAAERLVDAMEKVEVNRENMAKNLAMTGDLVLTEPFYILLSVLGHPDAHEISRRLSQQAKAEGKSLREVVDAEKSLKKYVKRMSVKQKEILFNPKLYVGIAERRTLEIAKKWKEEFNPPRRGIPRA